MTLNSETAHKFAWSSDSVKTAYVGKFGLAPYSSDQLVAEANKDELCFNVGRELQPNPKNQTSGSMSAIGAKITSSPNICDCSSIVELVSEKH